MSSDKRTIAGNTKAAELYGYEFDYKKHSHIANTEMYHVRLCKRYKEPSGSRMIDKEMVRVKLFTVAKYKAMFIEEFSDHAKKNSRGNVSWHELYEKANGENGIDLLFNPTLYTEAPQLIEFKTKSSVSQAKIGLLRMYAVDTMGYTKERADELGLKDLKASVIEYLKLDTKEV